MKPLRGFGSWKPLRGFGSSKPLRGDFAFRFAITLVAVALAFAQPRVTPLWSLYVGDRAAGDGEVLFLEPFPNAASCGAAARALGTTGQWTTCRARLSVSLGRALRLVTLQREFVPGGAWERLEALCGLDGAGSVRAHPLQTSIRSDDTNS